MSAGLLVWALSGVSIARTPMGSTTGLIQVVAWLVFGGAFLSEFLRPTLAFRWSLLLQTVCAVSLVWAPEGEAVRAMLLVVVASQLPVLFSFPICLAWVFVQTALAFAPRLWMAGLTNAAPPALGYLAFQVFAVGASGLAESERRAREELARAKGRLEALQERLVETTREAERLRIARELHDALGHQLTALALDLEAARHLVTGEATELVQRARALASSLMASLRDAVTDLREDTGPDLVLALQALARHEGRPRVDVECDPTVERVPQPARLALVRVAQEIVTNTTKHAHASTLRLSLRNADHAWVLRGEDDGTGAARVCAGHGLSGMRERIEGLRGTLTIETSPGRGFIVTAAIPKAAGT